MWELVLIEPLQTPADHLPIMKHSMQLPTPACLRLARPLEAQLANMECNATSAVQITHHFLRKMVRIETRERPRQQRLCRPSAVSLPPACIAWQGLQPRIWCTWIAAYTLF